ncbi:TetR/AcrR family transcriptional regulator [Nocardia sp. NPDC055053]
MIEKVHPERIADRMPAHRRRSQLIAVATEIFALRGYHDTSIREISQRAGITKPVIYKHFSGKLDLYLAVLQSYLDELISGMLNALRSSGDTRARIHAAVQFYFDFVDDECHAFRLIFESPVITEPAVEWRLNQTTNACVSAVYDLLIEDVGVTPRQARILAVGLVGASQFTARYWLQAGRPIARAEAVDTVFDLCWGGVSEVPLQLAD